MMMPIEPGLVAMEFRDMQTPIHSQHISVVSPLSALLWRHVAKTFQLSVVAAQVVIPLLCLCTCSAQMQLTPGNGEFAQDALK